MDDDEVRDRLAIHELYGRYAFGIDGQDPEALTRCFTDDAIFEHFAGRMQGRKAIGELVKTYSTPGRSRATHFVSSVAILSLDTEKGMATSTAHWMAAKTDGSFNFGTYSDTLRRSSDGDWQFAEHYVHHLRRANAPAS